MTQPKKFVFVLMPFDSSFNDIYTFGIKQCCTELNTYCERVDEQIYTERILDRIYNQISKADIIIADMTNRNPNVFYEVGYAHGLNKNVILLTQKADDIPFDLKHYPHIIYNGQIKSLSEQLKIRLDWFINVNETDEITNLDFGLEFLINGQKIEEGKEIKINEDLEHSWDEYFDLKITIYNSSAKIYKSNFKIGIETDIDFKDTIIGLDSIKPSTNKILFVSKELTNVYPNAYENIGFSIKQLIDQDRKPTRINCKLKVFTNFELREINFTLEVPTKPISPW